MKISSSQRPQLHDVFRGKVLNVFGSRDSWMYPWPNVPRHGKSLYKPYSSWVCMGYNPEESLENTKNTMGILLGVHPIVR